MNDKPVLVGEVVGGSRPAYAKRAKSDMWSHNKNRLIDYIND